MAMLSTNNMLIRRAAAALQMHSHQRSLGSSAASMPRQHLTPEGPLGEEAHCSATNAKQQGFNEG
jgi:hypothetical protein